MNILFFFVVSSSFVLTCFLSDFRMKNFYCGRSIFVEFWDDVRKLHITSGRYKRISSRDDRNKRLASSELNRDIRGKSWKKHYLFLEEGFKDTYSRLRWNMLELLVSVRSL